MVFVNGLASWHTCFMPDRSSKPAKHQMPADPNVLAASILAHATGGSKPGEKTKDPLAVELGRRGGLKGGKARAAKLSAKKKTEIARRAAKARWSR
jgi:hypothetical protein